MIRSKVDTWRAQETASPINGMAALNIAGQTWRQRAACNVSSPDEDLWYSDRAYDKIMAATKCTTCPVQTECLAAAIANHEQWGIHGGIDFTRARSKNKNPAYCKNGHLIADNMYVRRGGRLVACGICERDKAVGWAEQRELKAAARKRKNERERELRATKIRALGKAREQGSGHGVVGSI